MSGAENKNQTTTDDTTESAQSCFPLNRLSPEEITLAAAVFAIALGETMTLDDAGLLAFFLGTVSSNLGIFLEKKRRDLAAPEAEAPFPDVI